MAPFTGGEAFQFGPLEGLPSHGTLSNDPHDDPGEDMADVPLKREVMGRAAVGVADVSRLDFGPRGAII